MSQEVNLSAIKKAIDDALGAIDAYLGQEKTDDGDRQYAQKLKGMLEDMGSAVEAECGNPHFRPTLKDA